MALIPNNSAQKLRVQNALSEITNSPTLKALALANLGLADVAGSNVAVASGKTLAVSNSLTLAGTDGTTITFPATSATIARTDAANTFTGVQTMTAPAITGATLAAGSATVAPLRLASGTNLTTPVTGAVEYDGAASYITNDTTSGRGYVNVEQRFRLTSAGSTISTIANFFGTTSNIPLVASGFYEIDVYAWFLKTTAGTVVWTLTNSAAPTSQNIVYEMSPITGIVAPPGTATMLSGQIYNDATAALALSATGTLSDAVNHYAHIKVFLQNGAGTSLKIQATVSAGSITPGIGSKWISRRLPTTSVGAVAA